MAIDPNTTAAVDEMLSTTRAVRRRLDLDRHVEDDVILDCIDIAEQAPTGGNQGSRRWIIVRDPALKERLAELYREAVGFDAVAARARGISGNSRQERVLKSAVFLAEHLGEVPVIVIPTILGRHDGSGRPGLFDSVIQSAWSFCVALRARGLGTTWTTVGLSKAAEIKELLGIPDDVTEIAMFPVAYTKGTDFRRAPRLPAREIAFFDGYARTFEHGPGDPVSIADCPGTVVEVDIRAKPADVWELVTDISVPVSFSEEVVSARWLERADDSAVSVGDRFIGRNQHSARDDWEVECLVDVCSEPSSFGWCTGSVDNPAARWRFELEPVAGAARLRFKAIIGPGPSGLTPIIESLPDLEPRIISIRIDEHRANMTRVVEGIKSLAEHASTS